MIFDQCVISVCIRCYSGPHIPSFGLNTERYSVSLPIQSQCGKMRIGITPDTDTFYIAKLFCQSGICKCRYGSSIKNFVKFTERHLCWSLFFNKAAAWKLRKERLRHRCFPVNSEKFSERIYRTPPVDCFWRKDLIISLETPVQRFKKSALKSFSTMTVCSII